MRRRTNTVDLAVPFNPVVASYNFKFAANFDGSFVTFQNVPSVGMRSKTAIESASIGSQYRGMTRFLFNPADYSGGLDDTKPMWLIVTSLDFAGVESPASSPHLILPYNPQPDRIVLIKGSAPAGTTQANSLELQLPGQCRDLSVQTDGTVDLQMSFEKGGSEIVVYSLQNLYTNFSKTFQSFSQLFVRGNISSTVFSATMSLRNNPL